MLAATAFSAAFSCKGLETFENDWFRLSVNPAGGRLLGIYSKVAGAELTDPGKGGCFADFSWDRWKSRKGLANAIYMTRGREKDGRIAITALGNAQGCQTDFLKVAKRYVSTPDSSALRIEYRFMNAPDAMSIQAYCPAVAVAIGLKGETMRYFYPQEDGGISAPRQRGGANRFMNTSPVARGWFATASPDGTGAAVTFPFEEVQDFYTWFKDVDVPATEVKFIPVGIDCGKSYDFTMELIPFKGLKTVSGAGGGFVGELDGGVCRIVCSRAGRVDALADGIRTQLDFARPGEMREFRTGASSVTLELAGAEVCRLDARPKQGSWRLSPPGDRRAAFSTEVDLACFTNFSVRACTPWAKPLAGGRLKAAVVTGLGNLPEIGELAARFDMEFRTIGVIGNTDAANRAINGPVYTYGDFFGRVTPEDLEREVRKVLSWKDAEVILLGGTPLDMLSAESRGIIESRVREGTGLVLVGQDRDAPAFGLKLRTPKGARGVPSPAGDAFASVPFGMLGASTVYDFDTSGAKVLAECEGCAYAAEYRLGAGRLVNLPYCAAVRKTYLQGGITPDLPDFCADGVPPVEHYYSLVAKAMLKAAGRSLPVEAGPASFSADAAAISYDSSVQGPVAVEWQVLNSFREVMAKGVMEAHLKRGGGRMELPLAPVPTFAGPMTLECSFRRSSIVYGWGAWEFRREESACISALDTDAKNYAEGQTVKASARIAGGAAGFDVRFRLIDNFGRVIAEETHPAAAKSEASLKLENALKMRSCTVSAELLLSGRTVARRQTWRVVRPSAEKLAWDDFELGIGGSIDVRRHLWPLLAKAYEDTGISTVTGSWGLYSEFCPRYGFNAAVSTYAGLLREDEPPQFAKTGDKRLLARRNCVSAPEFYESRRKTLAAYGETIRNSGLRWHGFGDEQSLTGYEGKAIDFCFSEHCLKEFRAFVKGRYGTLERLNEEYESSFAGWDDVMPFTRQEVWAANGKHVAGWSDHLEFMDSRATNAIAFCSAIIRQEDPHIRLSLSGTQPPAAYSGMDWWKMMQVLDCVLSYKIGGQLDLHRSFRPDGRFIPWEWGYGNRGNTGVVKLWSALFHGCHGVMGFWSRSMFRPDLTPSHGISDVAVHLDRLVHGTGRHVIANLHPASEVAILYSQASLRAAFIEERRGEHDALLERCRQTLRSMGCAFDYISYDELARGEAAKRGYKALVLADARAMDDGEIAAVRSFARGGGAVVAISMPAVRKANCRLRAKIPFRGFFDNRRKILLEPAEDAAEFRMAMKSAMKAAGVAADELSISTANGGRDDGARIYSMRDSAGNPFWGIETSAFEDRTVTVKFPKRGWVCDLVDGTAYGTVDSVKVLHGRGSPHAFAILPEASGIASLGVDGGRVRVDCGSRADTVVRLSVFRPDGSEAGCYAANLTAKGGRAAHRIPFAISDPHGEWTVRVENVMDAKSRREARLLR